MHRSGDPTSNRIGARVAAGLCGLVAVAVALPACKDDGRTLRPANPDQTASVSTLAPVTEPPRPADDVLGNIGAFDLPATTVAPTTDPATEATELAEPPLGGAVLHVPWSAGASVDARFTCDGENISPALSWTPAPAGTVEIALALTDDDAPDFVHWAVAGLEPGTVSVGEGELPASAVESVNSAGALGYTGPCPPPGETHTYHYTVYFLGAPTDLTDGAAAADLLAAIRANAFDSASVSSTSRSA